MNGFKLLALRILQNTDKRFKKNLQEGIIYKFYQDYKYIDEGETEILPKNNNLESLFVKILPPETDSSNLYSSNSNLKISVSAIVGENGSGKSSIVDFYNLIKYFISFHHLNSLNSSRNNSFNRLLMHSKLTLEYMNAIQPFVQNKFEYKSFSKELDFALINESDSIIYIQEMSNYFSSINFFEYTNINTFNKTKNTKLFKICWRYISEFTDNNFINKVPNIPNSISNVFSFLNDCINENQEKLFQNLKKEAEFESLIFNNFNFQLFYQKDNDFHTFTKRGVYYCNVDSELFYTIHLNYSLHSLNSNHLGKWLDPLFHKNDGYQTPIVINPVREKGVININKEGNLSIDRLIYNIVDQLKNSSTATLLEKYKFEKVVLTLNKKKSDLVVFEKLKKKVDISDRKKFIAEIAKDEFNLIPNETVLDFVSGYCNKKFKRISRTYMLHFFTYDSNPIKDIGSRIEDLSNWQTIKGQEYVASNFSHVTRKFNQAYHFLVNYEYLRKKLSFLDQWNINESIELSAGQIINWIQAIRELKECDNLTTEDIILHFFPPIFNINLVFKIGEKTILFSDMSSGEQQYLFNINTIVYHINNLKSIVPVSGKDSKHRNYKHVNILLDEIELYYHPQYQKRFLNDIINSISNIDDLNELKSFNLMFLTHSPFILSDIPKQNVLCLEYGFPSRHEFGQTFGANINDLLANNFFLKNGFMGEFAKNWIRKLVVEINKLEVENMDESLFEYYKSKIKMIGEPVLRNSMFSMLENKFNSLLTLKSRESELQKELIIIQKKLKENGTD